MTNLLKVLLHNYGVLSVSLSHLQSQRPGTKHATLDEYYESLGAPERDEPVLLVRISKDNEMRFLEEGEHDVVIKGDSGEKTGVLTVWEFPEDEFYYFRAFRLGLFELEKDLPPFMFEMALAYGYSLFESYLAEIIRTRFRQHPYLMGAKKQIPYRQVFESQSKEALLDLLIDRETRELMYQPLPCLLEKMRKDLGFNNLTVEYDDSLYYFSMLRNCLLHNGGKADAKLTKIKSSIQEGERITVDDKVVTLAINSFRKFSYQVDQRLEALEARSLDKA